ncbi:RidA family protein [Halosolutus amylolyticus]|uniref:RidA family protein n=2 Tax=Halosolutus amylolyticus TaxID=2932267 RepID=A0ABD5PJ94_9EURY|nr:RidA family protein [Halosolutus amylolyticus]
MKKTALLPGMWGTIDSDEIGEPQMSYAVATEREGYRRVVFSGLTVSEGDLREQTRRILEDLEEALDILGGGMNHVVESRWYVLDEVLSRESQTALHEVRAEFFERPHYPASTMIGVSSLLGDGLLEIELVAEIPDDEWEVEAIEREDVEDD